MAGHFTGISPEFKTGVAALGARYVSIFPSLQVLTPHSAATFISSDHHQCRHSSHPVHRSPELYLDTRFQINFLNIPL